MKWFRLTALLAVFALAACGGGGDTGSTTTETPAERPATPATAATATIKGSVTYTGPAPARNRIKMGADPYCETQHTEPVYDESIVLGADGSSLENVFVYVKSGLDGQSFETPAEPIVFDQTHCQYNPHVFGIQANQELKILNSDATLHNVHATPKNSAEFNVGMPTKGMEITKKFKSPEIMVHIKCEVHPWMSAYAGVLDHPFFAVAGTGGSFQLPLLPAGTYTIEAWHEKLGSQTQEVVVGDGETKEITFAFQAGA